MATSLSSGYTVKTDWTFTKTDDDDTGTNQNNKTATATMTDGTTSGKSDRIYSDRLVLAASAATSLDLAGSLTDFFGSTITFVNVRAMQFSLTGASSVTIGGAAATAFEGWVSTGGTVTIETGGALFIGGSATTYPVGAGSTDKLKLLNNDSGVSATIDLVIVGTSA
jgi:hypothetical protein